MYRVCSLRLGPNFGMQLIAEKSFYLRLRSRKYMPTGFSRGNIDGHTAVLAPILRLRLTVQIHTLKYKLKSSKRKYKSTL